MRKWEYKQVITQEQGSLDKVNKLGLDGWELVSTISLRTGVVAFYLKREIK